MYFPVLVFNNGFLLLPPQDSYYSTLPDYKLKETMKQKILKAINYGKGAFHLS